MIRGLAQRLSAPRKLDWLKLKHLVKYLLGTEDWVWEFEGQPATEVLQAQSDSDWAQDAETRKSVSSGFLRLGKHVREH